MKKLQEYHRKRDFERTPEPSGAIEEAIALAGSEKAARFIIHKHAASHLHYDLRLEQDGVLMSWAVPKGPSLVPGEKRLAVKVEDHPLEYGDFEGVIPAKQYGGGTVMLWDRGHWARLERSDKKHKNTDDRIDFVLVGEKLIGAWTLVRTAGRDKKSAKNWMLIKRSDSVSEQSELTDLSVTSGRTMKEIANDGNAQTEEDTPSAKPSKTAKSKSTKKAIQKSKRDKNQRTVFDLASVTGAHKESLNVPHTPALATLVKEAPTGDAWLHEIKFDGYRIMAHCRSGQTELMSRNGKPWTKRFAEISQTLGNLTVREVVLDGEIVWLAEDGTSSFRNLQEAISAKDTRGLVYHVFDIIYLDGYDLTDVPLSTRKSILQKVLTSSGFSNTSQIRYTDHITGQGPDFFQQACVLGLEGIISKKARSKYRGGRNKNWLKTKCSNQEEFLICGYTRPAGSRTGFGALLLAAWRDNDLVYTGRVGTGFSKTTLLSLHKRLRDIEVQTSPLTIAPPQEPGVRWVNPELVAEVGFTEWTRDGVLRHPSFRGLREDKSPKDILLPEGAPKQPVNNTNSKPSKATRKNVVKKRSRTTEVSGVPLSSPERIFFPDQGVTKLQLAQYYEEVADWILPQVAFRLLSLVRCPSGYQNECFFQKHPRAAIDKNIPRLDIPEKSGTKPYLYVTDLPDLVRLVQAGALELHVWGSRVDDIERPDMLVFDLDPGPNIPLPEIFRVAQELRDRLDNIGLASFPRITGGKGLHLVVPLVAKLEWPEIKAFCQTIARQAALDDKTHLTANMAKSKRRGRTFIDYLRNGRGATAIASYSTRAREGAPVATPVSWKELNGALTPNRYNVENLRRRLSALQADPWIDFDAARRPITKHILRAVDAAKTTL